ncbi:MAG: cytochrome c biogenesis protein [Deferribacteraceae bacterium]|nr:cytochrome c biogenesis protein [Deferribacteraceae bacterium]
MIYNHVKEIAVVYYDLAVLLYILSFLSLLINYYFNKPIFQTLQMLFVGIAIFANATQILMQWLRMSSAPVYTLQALLILVSLMLAVVYLLINLRYKRPYAGVTLLPMIITAGLVSLFFTTEPVHSQALASLWLYVHIPLNVIGTALFLTAFTAGLMYFLLERRLKAKRFGRMFDRFPPLAVIDTINSAALHLGFAFYTAGLLTAAAWMRFKFHKAMGGINISDAFGGSLQNKIVLVCMVWLVVAVILLTKRVRGMSARQTALASVTGFASVILTYTGVVLFITR